HADLPPPQRVEVAAELPAELVETALRRVPDCQVRVEAHGPVEVGGLCGRTLGTTVGNGTADVGVPHVDVGHIISSRSPKRSTDSMRKFSTFPGLGQP